MNGLQFSRKKVMEGFKHLRREEHLKRQKRELMKCQFLSTRFTMSDQIPLRK